MEQRYSFHFQKRVYYQYEITTDLEVKDTFNLGMKLAQYRCILMHKYTFLDIVSEGMITNPNGQICSSIASYEVAIHT